MRLRTRVMIVGGIVGALLGVGAAYLYLRSAPLEVGEDGEEQLPAVNPGKALTASLGVLAALKQIVGMGQPS